MVNCQYEEMSENVFQVKYEKSARHRGMLAVWRVTAISLVVCMKKECLTQTDTLPVYVMVDLNVGK